MLKNLNLKKINSLVHNLKTEIFLALVFVLIRLPMLGFGFINTDAPTWKYRIFLFSTAVFSGDWKGTYVTYHPGVTLMWLGSIGLKFYNVFANIFFGTEKVGNPTTYLSLHFTQILVIDLFIAFTLVLSLYVIRRIFSKKIMYLFFLILTFEPTVVALTKVLHTDGLITFLSLLTILSIYYSLVFGLFQNLKRRFILWTFISSFSMALLLLTKSNGLVILAFSGFEYLAIYLMFKKIQSLKQLFSVAVPALIWLGLVVVFTFVLWPALWVIPSDIVKIYINGALGIGYESGHKHLWFGNLTRDPGILYYPVIVFIKYTPIFVLSTFSGLALFFYSQYKKIKTSKFFWIALIFVVFYSLIMSQSDKKLQRYILPVIPFLSLFAAYYLSELFTSLSKCKNKLCKTRYTYPTFTFIVGLNLLVSCWTIFPDYQAYFTPLVGGLKGGMFIDDPKWPLGYSKLAKLLNKDADSYDRVAFMQKGHILDLFYNGEGWDDSAVNTGNPGDYFILKDYKDFDSLGNIPWKNLRIMKIGNQDYYRIFELK